MQTLEAEYYSTGLFDNRCTILIDNIIVVDKEINGSRPTIEYIKGFIDGVKVSHPNILIHNKGEVFKSRN